MQLSQPVSESIACGIASFPGYPLWGWTVRMKCQCSAACGSGRFLHCAEIVNSCCHPPLFQGVIIFLLHEIRNCGINIVRFLSVSEQVAPALVGVPLQALPIPTAAPVRRKGGGTRKSEKGKGVREMRESVQTAMKRCESKEERLWGGS